MVGEPLADSTQEEWETYWKCWERYLEARLTFHALSVHEREVDDTWCWGSMSDQSYDKATLEEASRAKAESMAEAAARLKQSRVELLDDCAYLRARFSLPQRSEGNSNSTDDLSS